MNCWHCEKELEFCYQTADFSTKVYTCSDCDAWYEIRKQKPKSNASVPMMMFEIEPPKDTVIKAA